MRFSFDGFDIDTDSGQLFRSGEEVPLERRALDMLCYLALHPGRLITKDELLSEVWQAQTLTDNVLSNTASKLRKALGQAAGAREPIETVRGRGFRWHAVRLSGNHAAHSANLPVADSRSEPFVGRVQVMELLERAVDQAEQGHGQLVMLVGDAGMGKTRTLDELAKRARARGFSVWEGAAYGGGGAPPYWLWVEVLRSAHADLSRAMFRRHLPADSWAMSLLVPELVSTDSNLSADSAATRFRLFDEVARFIGSASADAPRLIIADDIHWADDGTLELLAHAARALKKHSVVLAVSLRYHDATAQDGRSAALQRLGRQATHVTLSGLSLREVEELVTAFGERHSVGARLTGVLYLRTQGNPFFVRQTLELLAQRGEPIDGHGLESLAIPPAVRDVLRQRIDALGDDTRRVLRVASAAGVEFDAGVLADVLEVPLAPVLSAIEPARRKRVVVSHPTTPHCFGFGHALLRDSIYDELDLVERGTFHARLGRVLEQRAAAEDPRSLGEIARHYLLAVPSDLDLCVRYCRLAADAARNALGFETAADLLSRASEKLEREGGDGRIRCELLLELGNDRFCVGDIPNAWSALSQGAALAEQIAATDLFARFACRLSGWLEIGGGDEEEIRRLVDRALLAVAESDSDLRAVLLAYRAEMHFELPADERNALFAEADALAARRDAPLVLLEIAQCRAWVRDPSRLDESRKAIANYRALTRRYPHAMATYRRLMWDFAVDFVEYLCAATSCDLAAADRAIERCRLIAEQSQMVHCVRVVELMQAGRAVGDGRFEDLEAILQRVSEGASLAGGLGLVWQNYVMRLVEAQGGFQNLAGFELSQLPRLDELRPNHRMRGKLYAAWFFTKVGANFGARWLLSTIPEEQLARMPVSFGDLGLLCLLAETYHALGDDAGAEELYQWLLPHATLNAVLPSLDYCGAVAHYLGILAKQLGHHDRAAQHWQSAEVINQQLGMPIQLARTSALARSLRTSSE